MRQINKYVMLINENNIIGVGRYFVGKDLAAGEYYLWGNTVRYEYRRDNLNNSKYGLNESYAVLECNDSFELFEGAMTHIDNISYISRKQTTLVPGHIYRVGKEILNGYYFYKYQKEYYRGEEAFLELGECAIDMYAAYSNSRFHRESGKYGCVLIDNPTKHIEVKNGIACYFGKEKFSETDFIDSVVKTSVDFNVTGVKLLENEIINIKLYQSMTDMCCFAGKEFVCVYKYYLYAVGGVLKCFFKIKPYSFCTLHSFKFEFKTSVGLSIYKMVEDCICRRIFDDSVLGEYYAISTELPAEYLDSGLQVILKKFNEIDTNEMLCCIDNEKDLSYLIRKQYRDEFKELKEVLQEYDGLDVEKELIYFEKCPDLIEKIIPTLKESIKARDCVGTKVEEGETVFNVKATYDKKFYCAAKISDMAVRVHTSADGFEFSVTFKNTQIKEIELMSYLLYDERRAEDQKIREFLNNNSIRYYTMDSIQKCIAELNGIYGYSSSVTNSVLSRIIKNEKKIMQRMIDRIYSEVVKENRVPTKWGNEYRLFSLISSLNENAIYQYHCDWLGQQSLDIYMNIEKIAIEYQGQQHYEAVEYFGGEENLRTYKERDARKKKLCAENGVRLLEWSYKDEVNLNSVRKFMQENDIPINKKNDYSVITDSIMAPTIKPKVKINRRRKRQEVVKTYIVQYDMQGNYVNRFTSVKDAAKCVNVSNTSISKTLRERNSAANYVWRKFESNQLIPHNIQILFDVKKTNSGTAKQIGKIGSDGNVERKFDSIASAERLTGISSNHIENELRKGISTEWTYIVGNNC